MALPNIFGLYDRTPDALVDMIKRILDDRIKTAPAKFTDIKPLRSMLAQAATLSSYKADTPNPVHPLSAWIPPTEPTLKEKAAAAYTNRKAREARETDAEIRTRAQITRAALSPAVHVWRDDSNNVRSELFVRVSASQLRKHCPESVEMLLMSVGAPVRSTSAIYTIADTPTARNPAEQRAAAECIYKRLRPAPAPVFVQRNPRSPSTVPVLASIPETDDTSAMSDDDDIPSAARPTAVV